MLKTYRIVYRGDVRKWYTGKEVGPSLERNLHLNQW